MINGYQHPFDDGLQLMACAKHFAAYGAAIGGRDYNTVDISMQKFQKDYSAATKRYFMPEVFRKSGAPKAQKH